MIFTGTTFIQGFPNLSHPSSVTLKRVNVESLLSRFPPYYSKVKYICAIVEIVWAKYLMQYKYSGKV